MSNPRVMLAKALQERAWRAKRNRLKYYRPYEKQREFHAQGAAYRERLFSAGNQLGKTYSGTYETAMHLTGRYPEWWEGKVFQKPTVGWAASASAALTRDGMQRLLLGRPGVESDRGTAAIPADAIKEISLLAGVPGAVSLIVVRHGGGDVQAGESVLGFRNYEQGRAKFQAETLDFVWLDEEPPHDIYMEAITRPERKEGGVPPSWRKLVMRRKEWPPLRSLMLLVLALSATGCTPTQTCWLAPQLPEIPMLPMEARQGPAPSICLPTCSAGLAAELKRLQELRTVPASPDRPVSGHMTAWGGGDRRVMP